MQSPQGSHGANRSVALPCTGSLVLYTTAPQGLVLASTSTLLKMVLIITKDKIKKFLTAGNDITIPILLLVKDTSGTFPPLQLATTGVLFIATNVKVSSVYPKRQLTFLLTVHIRASRRTRNTGMSSATMLQRWLEKLHCNGRCLVILAQKHH